MLMYCVVHTKYTDGEENISQGNTNEKENLIQNNKKKSCKIRFAANEVLGDTRTETFV